MTRYTPSQPVSISVALGTDAADPMIEKTVNYFERLQEEGTEFFKPEHQSDAAAAKHIITKQIELFKSRLME